MNLALPKKRVAPSDNDTPPSRWATLRSWLFSWEIYLIVLMAGFLRLYRINTTEFDDDQAAVFHMAHHAVTHGMLAATSNLASIHIYNPPAVIYFFMLPAALSANPVWGAVLVAVLAIASVLLTYVFTRRYYGRVVGTIAALLYATAVQPVIYSRFIWNQNLVPLFTILCLFALFWGVVERRKGWLFPALFLLGLLVQLHASGIFLAAPLLAALILAPRTVRWRDLVLGFLSLFLLYLPYILWEVSTHFMDVHTLLLAVKQKSIIDGTSWLFYQYFLSPYTASPKDTHTVLYGVAPFLSWLQITMTVLVICGAALALGIALWSRSVLERPANVARKRNIFAPLWQSIEGYMRTLWANPVRCGLIVLLVWQVVPLVYLSRHSLKLYPYYLLVLMPGPFILIGFFLSRVYNDIPRVPARGYPSHSWWNARSLKWIMHAAVGILTLAIVVAQLVGSTATVLDYARGNFNDRVYSHPYYNDLASLQSAVHEADQLAQQHHFTHVYISTDWATHAAFQYLSGQMRTPATVFDDASCLVLPSVTSGPAVMLVGPYSGFTSALITHFAHATQVAEPKRLGGPPFHLYIVTPTTERVVSNGTFTHNLQFMNTSTRPLAFNGTVWLATRWRLLRSAQPSYFTTYSYALTQTMHNSTAQTTQSSNTCTFTAMRVGDQLLVPFQVSQGSPVGVLASSTLTVKAQAYDTTPYNLAYGFLSFETYREVISPQVTLYTSAGKANLTVPVSG